MLFSFVLPLDACDQAMVSLRNDLRKHTMEISGYAKAKMWQDALHVFSQMPELTVPSARLGMFFGSFLNQLTAPRRSFSKSRRGSLVCVVCTVFVQLVLIYSSSYPSTCQF